jgi:rare lipoprotein A (peptidoglycan hydrolase)
VENPANGRVADARPVDWGPNISTGRVADLSPGLAKALGLQTHDVVRITISALRAIPVKPAKRVNKLFRSVDPRRRENLSSNSSSAARTVAPARPEPKLTKLFSIALKDRWPLHWRSFKKLIGGKFPRTMSLIATATLPDGQRQ